MKTIVVAYDKNYGIGAKNDLLWLRDLPDDLKHFKQLTTGGAIIMGRKTFDSIGRALPERQNIVISRESFDVPADVQVVHSLQDAYDAVEAGRETYVIGGGQIYTLAMDTVDCIKATEVNANFSQAEIFFPTIDPRVWVETDRVHHEADERNLYDFDFVTYERR